MAGDMTPSIADEVIVVGGGLAGCEAAFQIAKSGVKVRLYEMRPEVNTPAHRTGLLGELVCSSSLKSNSLGNAHGLLKHEMRVLGSIVVQCADETSVPGGDALCVDREAFSRLLTDRIEQNPNISVVREQVNAIPPERPLIIATGPLTSSGLSDAIKEVTGSDNLHFFDAIAPSVDVDSIDESRVFRQARYDKGEPAYINCPMDESQYEGFIDALLEAKTANLHLEEEKEVRYFEGCLPIEVIARRGRETLAHGTMKPVGLTDPRSGEMAHAVVQLRQENKEATIYGLVGFQTQLRPSEQGRVFRMIPGLENAEFVRYGAVHRNTYLNAPKLLTSFLHTKLDMGFFFAGQIVGVEGYMESAASGLMAGVNAARVALGEKPIVPPRETMIASLVDYVENCPVDDYQPMNSNFGLLPPIPKVRPKKLRKEKMSERGIKAMQEFASANGLD